MALARPTQVNALPLEILSSIFITLVDASLYARSIGDKSYGSSEYPTLLSSVCAHWRRVSINTPYLWCYIDLMPSNEHMRNPEHVLLWLERSQNSPLRVRVGKGGREDEERESEERSWEYHHNLARTLDDQLALVVASSAPRVRSFTLKFFNPRLATETLMALLPEEGQHHIRELALRQGRSISLHRSQLLPQNEQNRLLEPLYVLHLERARIELSNTPCRNLVELQLISPPEFSIVQFIQLLESNPGLRTIVLDGLTLGDGQPSSTTRPINLPSLRYFQLSAGQGFIESIFKLLVIGPHGLDLHLRCPREPAGFMAILIPFFQRTIVTSLYLQARKLSMLPVLTALPHLENLGLSTLDFDASTFAGLEPTINLLPNLHTIDLNECNFDDYSELYPGLRALLSLPSVRRIRHLNCGHWDVPGNRERVVQMLEEGGFAAAVVRASASDFKTRTSPFR